MNSVPMIISRSASSKIIQEALLRSSARVGSSKLASGKAIPTVHINMLPFENILSVGSLQTLQSAMIRISHYIVTNKFMFLAGFLFGVAAGIGIWYRLSPKQKQYILGKINVFVNKIQVLIGHIKDKAVEIFITPIVKSNFFKSMTSTFKCIKNFILRRPLTMTGELTPIVPTEDNIVQADNVVPVNDFPETEYTEELVGEDIDEYAIFLPEGDITDAVADRPPTPNPGFEFHPIGTNNVILESVELYVSSLLQGHENTPPLVTTIASSSISILNSSIMVLNNPPTNEIYEEHLREIIDGQIGRHFQQYLSRYSK